MEDFAKKGAVKPQLDQFNKKLKEVFGYVHEASVGYLNFVGNDFRDQDNYEVAIEIYKLGLEKKPEDVRLHVSICDLYDKMDKKELAKPMFVKTKKLLEAQKADFSDNYYNNHMEWIDERLKSFE
jgi:tetratricopeptide (TPR) repeat protein